MGCLVEEFPYDAPIDAKSLEGIVGEAEIGWIFFKRGIEMAYLCVDAGALDLECQPEIGDQVVAYLNVGLPIEGTENGIPFVGPIGRVVAQIDAGLHA